MNPRRTCVRQGGISHALIVSLLRWCWILASRLLNNSSIRAALLSLPSGEKQLPHVKTRQRVRLRVEHDLVQRQKVIRREQQIEVLQRLRLQESCQSLLYKFVSWSKKL